jgi:excinuclease ABC subunit A
VKYKGKSIYDVLDMTIEEAAKFFENVPSIQNKIMTMCDVGLGYVKLGQPSTELSGGEAQRIKLAAELSRKSTGKTIYILDEPTTGLHFADVDKLVKILQRLTDSGNTVVVIEHNLDVIKCADYIIDIGPEGGDAGGTIIARGTPEEIAKCHDSYTGYYVNKMLQTSK